MYHHSYYALTGSTYSHINQDIQIQILKKLTTLQTLNDHWIAFLHNRRQERPSLGEMVHVASLKFGVGDRLKFYVM